jgi:hypothetical protein
LSQQADKIHFRLRKHHFLADAFFVDGLRAALAAGFVAFLKDFADAAALQGELVLAFAAFSFVASFEFMDVNSVACV